MNDKQVFCVYHVLIIIVSALDVKSSFILTASLWDNFYSHPEFYQWEKWNT